MKISCAFLICLLFVVAVISSSGKEAWKVSNFSSFILDINYIQFWKWKVFLADLIFLLKFSVVLLHLGYSSLAVYPCRVVFVLILLSSSIFSASSTLPKNSNPPRRASPFRSIDTCRQTSYFGQQKELDVKIKIIKPIRKGEIFWTNN